jgi:hypothetical protein
VSVINNYVLILEFNVAVMAAWQFYRNTTLGQCLEDSLDEMVQVNKCLKVLEYFLEKGSQ